MHFASDNAGPAHPAILEALSAANDGYALGYGNDPLSEAVRETVREVFEAPEAAVHLVPTGTAANALILGTMARPVQTIYCTEMSHINVDECNAPEFYSGGAKLTLIETESARMRPEPLARAMETASGNVHAAQPGPVSITTVTERGTLYDLDEIRALADIAHGHGQRLHLDGARFANAAVALGCSAAEMTWKAGVDAVSFGGTKNGCLGVEACVVFDPDLSWEVQLRRKRGGHLFSKYRYLAAQMGAYLEGALWRDLATRANAAMAHLYAGLRGAGLGDTVLYPPAANLLYMRWPRALHQRVLGAGAVYYIEEGALDGDDPDEILTGRLVTNWATTEAEVDGFLALLQPAVAAR